MTRFVGRWVREPNGIGMRCGWSGSYVVGRFKGTGVSARIKDEGFNLFQAVIDGEVKKVLRTDKAKGEALYPLADGLADAVHDVSIHRRAEAKVGEVVFYGFEPSAPDPREAKMLAPPPPSERRIETIGDSITTGFGNEGPNATCGYVNSEQNEYLTYGAIAARNLSADHTTIAWSGKTIHEMNEYFDKSLPQRNDGPRWDFSQYQPNVVVLNVGTNNFALVDPGEARFVRVYTELVHDVRAAYPKAFIVCALGSMLSNVYPENRNNLTQARKYMKVAVAKLKDSGETNLDFLEFPEQNHADGLGCGFHPSLKTHKQMGERLTAFIKEHLGW
jgi:lysophospholipase L1-like esterase